METSLSWYKKPWILDCIALISGALLPLAFAPNNVWFLAFISPALWLLTLLNIKSGRAFWRGWLYGFGMMLIGASWIFVSIYYFGNTPLWLAALGTLGFVAVLGLFFALQAFCLVRFFPTTHWVKLTLAFACMWVFQEWLRSCVLTGFPWLLLGNSQVSTWLGNYAPVTSVYGVSFLVAVCAGLLANLARQQRRYYKSIIAILIIFAGGYILGNINWTQAAGAPVKVSLVQGDIAQSVKWNPDALSLSLSRYRDFTELNWQSAIIAWPAPSPTHPPLPLARSLPRACPTPPAPACARGASGAAREAPPVSKSCAHKVRNTLWGVSYFNDFEVVYFKYFEVPLFKSFEVTSK